MAVDSFPFSRTTTPERRGGAAHLFSDEALIEVRSGNGGAGALSFRREKYVPRGGPDGGDGGRGGDVVVRVRSNVKTLSHLRMRQRFFASNGRPGSGRRMTGARGDDAVIEVPPGTIIYDADLDEPMADLTHVGEERVLLSGGRGGKGNHHFRTSRHRTPRFAQPGEPGEERRLRVELRVIADVGFVGLPNAGKSSLLKALTNADPRIAPYPFTTVVPNLGVLRRGDTDCVLADIPGIIEGAADGAGLGLQFLRHISRAAGLAFVVEYTNPDPGAQLAVLRRELGRFDPLLLDRNAILVFTKADLADARAPTHADSGDLPPAVVTSSFSGDGLDELRDALFAMLARADAGEATESGPGAAGADAPGEARDDG